MTLEERTRMIAELTVRLAEITDRLAAMTAIPPRATDSRGRFFNLSPRDLTAEYFNGAIVIAEINRLRAGGGRP